MKVTNADDHCCWLCCILSVIMCDLFLKLQRRDGDEAGVFTKVAPDFQCQIPATANNILLFCCLIPGLSFCYNQKHRYFISTLCFWVHQIEDPSNYSDRHWAPLWAGVKQRRGDHSRIWEEGTPAPAPWPPSPRSSGSPSSHSSSSTSATPCVSPCRSATTIKPLNQKF